jgi:sulfur carrier protein
MNITLNGEPRTLPAGTRVAQLLAGMDLAGRRVALEVNGEIVPRSRHAEFELHDGDVVELVHAVGGG